MSQYMKFYIRDAKLDKDGECAWVAFKQISRSSAHVLYRYYGEFAPYEKEPVLLSEESRKKGIDYAYNMRQQMFQHIETHLGELVIIGAKSANLIETIEQTNNIKDKLYNNYNIIEELIEMEWFLKDTLKLEIRIGIETPDIIYTLSNKGEEK